VLWLAGAGAFLLYVPILPVLVVALILFGQAVMFALGVEVGRSGPDETGQIKETQDEFAHYVR
jgi:hypothetical protein